MARHRNPSDGREASGCRLVLVGSAAAVPSQTRSVRGLDDLWRNADGWIPCPSCGQPLVEETDGTHCGGCAVSWWQAA
jgi:hypothetical protein